VAAFPISWATQRVLDEWAEHRRGFAQNKQGVIQGVPDVCGRGMELTLENPKPLDARGRTDNRLDAEEDEWPSTRSGCTGKIKGLHANPIASQAGLNSMTG
jgi:hypothetical protein